MARGRNRQRHVREEKPLLLILCEDSGGIESYIKHTFRSTRTDRVAIKVLGLGADPKRLLETARVALKGGNRRVPPADFVFLVFDADKHPHFKAVVQTIHKEDRIIAFVSIPCIEYYLLLHMEMTTVAAISYNQVYGKLVSYKEFTSYDKKVGSVPIGALSNRQQMANTNARKAREDCKRSGAVGPLTDMDLFVEFVEKAKAEGLSQFIGLADERLYWG